MYNLGIILALI